MAKRNDDRWPKGKSECASFEELTEPIVRALRFAYNFQRKNNKRAIPWTGLSLGPDCAATSLSPEEALSKDSLTWSLDEYGRDALEVVVQIAVQLGIEQGRRLAMNKLKEQLALPLIHMDGMRGFMWDLKDKCGYDEPKEKPEEVEDDGEAD